MFEGQRTADREPAAGRSPDRALPESSEHASRKIDRDLVSAYFDPLDLPLSGSAAAEFAEGRSGSDRSAAAPPSGEDSVLASSSVPPPRPPLTLVDSGLSLSAVADLVLKVLYVHGLLIGNDIAQHVRLAFPIVDEALQFLKDQRLIEVSGGDLLGRISYRFTLTELGRHRAREAFEHCRYVGPAPVPVEQYVAQCRRQGVAGISCTSAALQQAFRGLVLRGELLSELGPAVCSGRSIFLYGPPGNGKTVLAKGLGRFLHLYGGEIFVPYALLVENSIVTVFDPVVHQTTDDAELSRRGLTARCAASDTGVSLLHNAPNDRRWRRIRRPIVITGGELTLNMLELQYHRAGNFYAAPLHIKANGGVFLIDDFGRQLVSPRDLLNRWIVPLEERIDYLTLMTGRKFALPFDQLIIFSTNLDPKDLVDDAFLRRMRHKIRVDAPTRSVYAQIFETVSQERGFGSSAASVDFLFATYYDQGRLPRSSDPRDLHDLAESICRFEGLPLRWTQDLVAKAARRLFQDV
jgi:predicted ATPase with chaperone activity